MHQLCEKIVQETPALLEEAAEQVFRENPLIRKACPLEKTLLESYQEKPMLWIMVDQYLKKRYPERFTTVRERYDAQLAAIEEKMVVRKHASA